MNSKEKAVVNIKKAAINIYKFQIALLLVFFTVRLMGVSVPIPLVALFCFAGHFAEDSYFAKVLSKNLKEVSSELYDEIFQIYPYGLDPKLLTYVHPSDDDTGDIIEVKRYTRYAFRAPIFMFGVAVIMMIFS